ncbi:MAG TPA: hypothetical protein VEL51_13465, partial [Vicinamibacterales bacterium]|nr:hypothetical protein [Vicinamibacterales bacterium]
FDSESQAEGLRFIVRDATNIRVLGSSSTLSQAKRLNQRRQRRGLLPSARVVQEVTGERLAPVFEHAH